ncbi:hypothetical protein FRX31_009556 [Thalictrum thalictroides]|uniref:CCHC-type domain-containing protein n=1 Tax=Thalictrum thalictroides TaxID=46969 RepID=A0A7J6WVC2_THATH|nr:hypothetical protein FRX31_009556 [Thalictrum thalictroides]
MLTTSTTAINPGRKYLACQFNSCKGGWQWLDEAIAEAESTIKSPSKACYGCGVEGHWLKNCPWKGLSCRIENCRGKRHLKTSEKLKSSGWKFLKCYDCNDFQWLKHAIEEMAETSQSVGSSSNSAATVQINMSLNDFCNQFEMKTNLK